MRRFLFLSRGRKSKWKNLLVSPKRGSQFLWTQLVRRPFFRDPKRCSPLFGSFGQLRMAAPLCMRRPEVGIWRLCPGSVQKSALPPFPLAICWLFENLGAESDNVRNPFFRYTNRRRSTQKAPGSIPPRSAPVPGPLSNPRSKPRPRHPRGKRGKGVDPLVQRH